MKSKFFFFFPYQPKRIYRFSWIFALILSFCLPLLASDEAQTSEDARQLVKQAEKLIHKGKFDEAENILRRLVSQNLAGSKAKLSLSHLLLKKQNLLESYKLAL